MCKLVELHLSSLGEERIRQQAEWPKPVLALFISIGAWLEPYVAKSMLKLEVDKSMPFAPSMALVLSGGATVHFFTSPRPVLGATGGVRIEGDFRSEWLLWEAEDWRDWVLRFEDPGLLGRTSFEALNEHAFLDMLLRMINPRLM